ncbi:TetR/AcrR family transcriptional regulator [Neobacillus niacini]|jgi:TetR/AcrR family transcriptional regulator|uniref:TetR/AcrR family transcriptional regulator n=1 Tax=Neobacillus niacini TaxID=86668 RepID=UPI001C8E692F|nr:TetR/AcrR family transcriptional regulator [Neobacillus niacini]MBY0148122.1 TetR/AcrR family transcriptional regulator [Neobacillus niacini]
MFSKFLSLDLEKQDRIINAAIKEFAQKGYDSASTNEIVKEAGISKGLLFHYFQSKKQLFFFLFDYCYKLVADEFYKKVDLTERDFFKRVRQAVHIKMDLQSKYPEILTFIQEAFMQDSPEIKVEFDKKKQELNAINIGIIYDGIDLSKFREDVDPQKILKIISWTFEKMSDEELLKAKMIPGHKIDYDKVFLEAEEYFEVFIKCFYK